MGFLDIGPLEILLILIVALLIWGPRKIPEIARTLGKTVRAFRKAASDLTTSVNKELSIEEKDHSFQPGVSSDNNTKESSDIDTAESSNTEIVSPRDLRDNSDNE